MENFIFCAVEIMFFPSVLGNIAQGLSTDRACEVCEMTKGNTLGTD